MTGDIDWSRASLGNSIDSLNIPPMEEVLTKAQEYVEHAEEQIAQAAESAIEGGQAPPPKMSINLVLTDEAVNALQSVPVTLEPTGDIERDLAQFGIAKKNNLHAKEVIGGVELDTDKITNRQEALAEIAKHKEQENDGPVRTRFATPE
jgi:hypothetical protein